jgi:type II secretory pathway component PulK
MTREILYGGPKKQADGKLRWTRGLADFVTVYSDQSQINLNYAEPEVLASLPGIDLDLARLIVGARKSRPFDSGSALSQRIPGIVRGEALSSLSTQLSRTFCLVATAFPVGSKLRRSIMTVIRVDSTIRARHEKLIWYDEYWPSEHLLHWIDAQTAGPASQVINASSRQGWASIC